MKTILTIAWRNIWRQPKRTALTVATITLGLGLLLVSIGLGDGGHYQMIETAVRQGSGHVLIQEQGYQRSRSIARVLDSRDQSMALRWIDSVPSSFKVESVLRRVFASGIAASADGSAGILIIGFEPELEKRSSRFNEKLIAGAFPDSDDSDRVILGEGVGRKLSVKEGDKVVLTAQEALGPELQSVLVRVGGLLRTGAEDLDESAVLAPIATVQRFLRMGKGVHQIAILLPDSRGSEPLARLGKAQLQGLEVLAWDEALPELSDFIRVDDAGNYLFNMVFFVLIAFLVLNTLLMSVLERNREFALLEAMGLVPEQRFAMVMLEAVMIAAMASLLGMGLGLAGHLYFAVHGLPLDVFSSGDISAAGVVMDPVIYSDLSWSRILGCIALVVAMTLLLALIPARRAARAADGSLLGRVR